MGTLSFKLDSSKFNSDLESTGKIIDLTSRRTQKAEKEIKSFAKATEDSSKRMRDSKGRYIKTIKDEAAGTKKLAEEQEKLTKQTKAAEKANRKLEKSYNSVFNAKELDKKVTVASIAVITAYTAAIGLSVAKSIEFAEGMANIGSLIPGNTDRVKELGEELKILSVSSGKSTADLSDGMYNVVSAFGDGADSVASLTIAVNAAQAGVASTTESLNLISAVTKAYSDTSVEAQKSVSDLALLAVREGQTSFGALAGAIGRTTASSAALGISQNELFSSFAALTGVIGNTNETATGLAAVNVSLLKPSKELAEILNRIGFESGESAIKQLGYRDTLKAVFEATGNNNAAFAKAIGSSEAFKAAITIAKDETGKFQRTLGMTKEGLDVTGLALKEQQEGVNSLGFQISRTTRVFEVLGITIGETVAPAFKLVLDSAFAIGSVASDMDVTLNSVAKSFVFVGGAASTFAAGSLVSVTLNSKLAEGAIFALTGKNHALTASYLASGKAVGTFIKSLSSVGIAIASVSFAYDKLNESVKIGNSLADEQSKSAKIQSDNADALLKKIIEREKKERELNGTQEKSIELAKEKAKAFAEVQVDSVSGIKTVAVKKGEGDSSLIDAQQKQLTNLEREKFILQEVSEGQKGLAEATLQASFAIDNQNKMTEEQINKSIENAKAIDEQTEANKKYEEAVKEAEKAEEARKQKIQQITDGINSNIQALNTENISIQENIKVLEAGNSLSDNAKQRKAQLITESGKFKDATKLEKDQLIESAIAVDESNKKLQERQDILKEQSAAKSFIERLKEQTQSIKDEIAGTEKAIEVSKEYSRATQEQKASIINLLEAKALLENDKLIKNLKEEIDNQQLSKKELREKTELQKLGNNATEEQINQVKELLELENKQTFEQKLDAQKKELAFLKLTNNEREKAIKLKSLGFEGASEEQQKKAVELEKQINEQKRKNKEESIKKAQQAAGFGSGISPQVNKDVLEKDKILTKEATKEIETLNEVKKESLDKDISNVKKEEALTDTLITTFEKRRNAQLEAETTILDFTKKAAKTVEESLTKANDSIEKLKEQSKDIDSAIVAIKPEQKKSSSQLTNQISALKESLLDTSDIDKRMDIIDKIKSLTVERYDTEKELAESVAKKQRDLAKERISLLNEEAEKQYDNFEKFKELSTDLKSTFSEVILSDKSLLTGEQKLNYAQEQFRQTARLAEGGDLEAGKRLGAEGKSLIEIGSEQYKSSPAFASIFEEVTGTLKGASESASTRAEKALTESEVLKRQSEIQEQNLTIQANIETSQKAAVDVLTQLRDLNADLQDKQTQSLKNIELQLSILNNRIQGIEQLSSNANQQAFANSGV